MTRTAPGCNSTRSTRTAGLFRSSPRATPASAVATIVCAHPGEQDSAASTTAGKAREATARNVMDSNLLIPIHDNAFRAGSKRKSGPGRELSPAERPAPARLEFRAAALLMVLDRNDDRFGSGGFFLPGEIRADFAGSQP